MTVSRPGGFYALGVTFANYSHADGRSLTYTFSSGSESWTVTVAAPTTGFFGIISSTPFNSLSMRLDVDYGRIVDMVYVAGAAVPEPGTVALASAGAIALSLRRRGRGSGSRAGRVGPGKSDHRVAG